MIVSKSNKTEIAPLAKFVTWIDIHEKHKMFRTGYNDERFILG